MIIWKPTACQIDSTIMAGIAVPGWLSQAMVDHPPPVTVLSIELNRPLS